MAMAMAKQQRSNSNWEEMLKRWSLSAYSVGTHRPAHSDGSHRPVPKWRCEDKLKRWIFEQGTHRLSPSSGNVYHHPAHSDGTHRPAPQWRGEAQRSKYLHQRELAMTKQQGGSNSNWEGMLKRWRLAKAYGCTPEWSEENDFAARVYTMAQFYFKVPEDEYDLKMQFIPADQFETWLEILQEYVGYMELAHELHSIDCLVPLLHYVLYYPHASVRAKTAELVTTMVHNNPKSQQLVIAVNGLQPLLYNISDPDATSRTKALGAISALIWNNKPCITAFQLDDGYAKLRDALSTETESVMFQREALNLIQYLLHENSSDCNIVTDLGLPHIMMHLASNDDLEVREAALRGLLILARDEGGNSGQRVKNDDKLKQVLQARIEGISAMAPEYLAAAREERQLVDSLWNACYNEPSSLGEKGLLVLSGEDAPVPDVASKLFEPPLRAWAAAEAVDINSVSEKKGCNIVTELGLPRIMIHLAFSDDAEVREAALRGLLVLTRDGGGNGGQLVKNDAKLKQVLQERIEGISAMAQLVDSLWNACYNEPSSLRDKGILVLPGEDALGA